MELQTLFAQFGVTISIVVIIFLLAIGYCIKHIKAFDKVSNNLIPIILVVLGAITTLLTKTADTSVVMALMNGIINAAVAIAIHQSGKNIFEMVTLSGSKIVIANEDEESKDDADLTSEDDKSE